MNGVYGVVSCVLGEILIIAYHHIPLPDGVAILLGAILGIAIWCAGAWLAE